MLELLNAYDCKNCLLKKPIIRGRKVKKGEFYKISEIFIISNNKILVTLRAANKKTDPDRWDIVGGHVKFGENSRTTAVREMKEEVGLDVKTKDLIKLQTLPFGKFYSDMFLIEGEYDLYSLVLQKEEISDAKFVTVEELKDMLQSNEFSENLTFRIYQCLSKIVEHIYR